MAKGSTGRKKKRTRAAGRSNAAARRKNAALLRQREEERQRRNALYRSEAGVIAAFAAAVIMLLGNFGLCGAAGRFLRSLQLGLFGLAGYVFPVVLILLVSYGIANKGNGKALAKIPAAVVFYLAVCGLVHLLFGAGYDGIGSLGTLYEAGTAGGALGGLFCGFLRNIFGAVGTFFILAAVMILMMVILTERSFVRAVEERAGRAGRQVRSDFERRREEHRIRAEERRALQEPPAPGIDFGATDFSGRPDSDTIRTELPDAMTASVRAGAARTVRTSADPASEVHPLPASASFQAAEPSQTAGSFQASDTASTADQVFAANRAPATDQAPTAQTAAPGTFAPETSGETVSPAAPSISDISPAVSQAEMRQAHAGEVPETAESEFAAAADSLEGVSQGKKPAGEVSSADASSPFAGASSSSVSAASPADAPAAAHAASFLHSVSEPRTIHSVLDEDPALQEAFRRADEILKQSGDALTSEPAHPITADDNTIRLAPEEPAEETDFFAEEQGGIEEEYSGAGEGSGAGEDFGAGEGSGAEKPDSDVFSPDASAGSGAADSQESGQVPYADVVEVNPGESAAEIWKGNESPEPSADSAHGASREISRTGPQGRTQGQPLGTSVETKEKEYRFPPLSLLEKGQPVTDTGEDEYRRTAQKLESTLKSFGVDVSVTNYSRGPAVTRYELLPAQGVKVGRIVALSDDIKLSLAAQDIRIEAPIPGKSAVGIEVPNKENHVVHLRELLESDQFRQSKAKIAFALGKDIAGRVVVTDISKMPHVLIAGATGSGKSVCINTMIMSILYRYRPDEVKLMMIDPKVVELSVYNGIPHLMLPVITDSKKAAGALAMAVAEMDDRYKKFASAGVRDLKGYNERIRKAQGSGTVNPDDLPKPLPQIVIIIDELADLMIVSKNEVEASIVRIAQLSRAAGMHLVIATQRPSVNVITGIIKANILTRIAFAVSSGVDSRTILDGVGAEKLLGKGDMLFSPMGSSRPQRIQGAFVSDEEVQKVVDYVRNEGLPLSYSSDTVEQIAFAAEPGASPASSGRDELFAQAGRFIIAKNKASIGNLQRMFKIGFNRAARIMDQLCEAGVVGEEQGTKPREILMTAEQFEELIRQSG